MSINQLYWVGVLLPIVLISLILILNSFRSKKKKHRWRVRLVDSLPPFLLISVHIQTLVKWNFSVLPYLLIALFSMGIILVVYTAYTYGEILYTQFFFRYWRLTLLFTFVWYFIFTFIIIL